MRRLCTSSGLKHSCAEGEEPSCRAHPIIPTKSIIRIELEQQTYADSNLFHEPAADCPERISGLQALLEDAPPLFDCKLLWHRALKELLDGTRDGLEHPWAIEIRD